MKNEPFIIERTLNAPIEKVWKALTETEQIKQWSFDVKGFKPQVGIEFGFDGQHDDVVFHHIAIVKEVIAGKKLSYTWRYDGYEGDSLVTWELFAEGNRTRVKLTHTGLETFPNLPDFARKNFVTGWTDIVGRLLKEYVEK